MTEKVRQQFGTKCFPR